MTSPPPLPSSSQARARASAAARSNFVTVLSLVFILMSAGGLLMLLLQYILFYFMLPAEALRQVAQDPALPPLAGLMFRHLREVLLFMLLSCIATLVTSIGLFKRREWARKLFIGLMCLGIVWQLGSIVFQAMFMSDMAGTMGDLPPAMAQQFQAMQYVATIIGGVFGLALAALQAWIILRLRREQVRSEFSPPQV